MRISLFSIALISLAVTIFIIINKRRQSKIEELPKTKTTEVKVPKTLIDIGDTRLETSAIGRFTIINVGKDDLYLKDVQPDCHCTVGEYYSRPVKPNDSTVIILRYDSTRMGVFQSTAKLEINSDQTPILLVFRGNMISSSGKNKK